MPFVWLYKRRESDNWYIDYSKDIKLRYGKRTRSLRIADKKRADLIRAKEESDILLGMHGIKHRPIVSIHFSRFAALFLEHKENQGIAPGTLLVYNFTFEVFGRFLKVDQKLHKITIREIESYAAYRRQAGIRPKTLRNELGTLYSAFKWGEKSGYVDENPMRDMPLPKVPRRPPDDVNNEDYGKLCRVIKSPQWRAIFDFYILTGVRRSEGPGILISRDVDFKGGLLYIRQSKQNDFRTLPLVGDLKKTVQKLVKYAKSAGVDNLIQPAGHRIYRNLRRYVRKAGITRNIRLHSLRHTFGTKLGALGASRTVQELMGHKDSRSTAIYVHPVNAAMKDVMKKLKLYKERAKK